MNDLAKLRIWDDPAVRSALSWYLDVADNRYPAKFRIAATVATQLDPAAGSEDALWAELDRLTPIFLARWQGIRAGAPLLPGNRVPVSICKGAAMLPVPPTKAAWLTRAPPPVKRPVMFSCAVPAVVRLKPFVASVF